MPQKQHPRDIAVTNLIRAASEFDIVEAEKFKNFCVILEYFSRPNHCGGIATPENDSPERRQLSDGKWIEWKTVPLKRVIAHAEHWIDCHTEKSKRTEIWDKLHEGLPGVRRIAEWDALPVSLNEYPATPYSASRAIHCPSNAEMIERLSKATEHDLSFLAEIFVHLDASYYRIGGVSRHIPNKLANRGGRLGRDHTLADVPHHWVRDKLMQWVAKNILQEDRRSVGKQVFADLNDQDLDAYAEHLRAVGIPPLPVHGEEDDKLEKDESKKQYHNRQRNIASELDDAVNGIDCDIGLTGHKPTFVTKLGPEFEPSFYSFIHPKQRRTKEENDVFPGDKVRYDCDQIRAMIARLVRFGDWTIEDFRVAIGSNIPRKKLTDFLNRRGSYGGDKLGTYLAAWEFFRKRELLSIPLPGQSVEPISGQSKKRKRGALAEQAVNVPAKAPELCRKDVQQLALSNEPTHGASKRIK